ncbi:hypothetical protein EDC14_101755 [Hydrogenispora ethanolica]|jgi:hypothetical protein|uniref:DUF4145 domain-containing protein n=1 Tax=Hydrogenispora ethanolica TaxID=1082276 RepID=A0A4V2QDR2_HYDET|nr:hypothetical protein [Hydrogenispora ethanolica]TCL65307.1 hypothetical protein EDC14_101755 [Hydrogenispora ethanolica]
MNPFKWHCPYCNCFGVVTETNFYQTQTTLDKGQDGPPRIITMEFVICPNPECRRFTFKVTMYLSKGRNEGEPENREFQWTLLPLSGCEQYFEGVPALILADYQEAVRILTLSPRSAALLARKCLQNILADFFKIAKPLGKAFPIVLKSRLDPVIAAGITARFQKEGRRLEEFIKQGLSLASAVKPEEVRELIWLVEILLRETYVSKYEKLKQVQEPPQS